MPSFFGGLNSSKLQSVIWGLTASLAWAGDNVGSKPGRLRGFDALDLTTLRYGLAQQSLLRLSIGEIQLLEQSVAEGRPHIEKYTVLCHEPVPRRQVADI